MKITNKKIVKHWLMTAYGEVDENYPDYLERVENMGIDSWSKEVINVKDIQTHHSGHDASDEYIDDYIQMKKEGSSFPAIIVKKINDNLFVTIDGQHRVKAAQELGEEKIDAYVGITTESFEERKEQFKERHSLEFISNFTRNPEKIKELQISVHKFIDQKYSEQFPWSSIYFNNNPYFFLDWFLANEYEGDINEK